MAISKSGLDNTKVQEMIALKIASGVTDAEGNKLSKSAIQAEFARAFIKNNQKKEDVDFLVYGIDNTG